MSPSAPAYQLMDSPTPTSVSPLDLIQRAHPLETATSGYLRHLLESVTSLKVSKPGISLALAEETVFLRPPRLSGPFEVDDGSKSGSGGHLQGFINVVSLTQKIVDDVRVSLIGRQHVGLANGSIAEFDVLSRKLSVAQMSGSNRVELQRGVNTFEFSIHLPATTSPSIPFSQYGQLHYKCKASVRGSGGLLKHKMSTERGVLVVCLPKQAEEDELPFRVDETHDQLWSGPQQISLWAERLAIASSIHLDIRLPAPPPNLTIFGVHVYVAQTVLLRTPGGAERTIFSPKRTLVREGCFDGWLQKEFPARAKKEMADKLLLKEGYRDELGWILTACGTIPEDNILKPTTLFYTDQTTGVILTHELVVDLLFQSTGSTEDERLMVASMYRQPCTISCACCNAASLVLPSYAESP